MWRHVPVLGEIIITIIRLFSARPTLEPYRLDITQSAKMKKKSTNKMFTIYSTCKISLYLDRYQRRPKLNRIKCKPIISAFSNISLLIPVTGAGSALEDAQDGTFTSSSHEPKNQWHCQQHCSNWTCPMRLLIAISATIVLSHFSIFSHCQFFSFVHLFFLYFYGAFALYYFHVAVCVFLLMTWQLKLHVTNYVVEVHVNSTSREHIRKIEQQLPNDLLYSQFWCNTKRD